MRAISTDSLGVCAILYGSLIGGMLGLASFGTFVLPQPALQFPPLRWLMLVVAGSAILQIPVGVGLLLRQRWAPTCASATSAGMVAALLMIPVAFIRGGEGFMWLAIACAAIVCPWPIWLALTLNRKP
jgi:hypothetical protein